jgi:hypothetical protein
LVVTAPPHAPADHPNPVASLTAVTDRASDRATIASARDEVVLFAAAFSMVAGLIHVEAAALHWNVALWHAVAFILLAIFQVAWALRVYSRPTPALLAAGAIISAGTIAIWAMSRTVGIPIPPDAWRPEEIGFLDVAATIDELAIVVLAVALLRDSLAWVTTTSLRLAVYSTLTLTGVSLFISGGHHH